jgi:hypothetical protein
MILAAARFDADLDTGALAGPLKAKPPAVHTKIGWGVLKKAAPHLKNPHDESH